MAADQDRSHLPLPESPFKGVIGETYLDSKEDWPKVPKPPEGAPNVVVIMLDDVGFGQVSTFGGPVPTRRWTSSLRAACGTTVFTPRRSAAPHARP